MFRIPARLLLCLLLPLAAAHAQPLTPAQRAEVVQTMRDALRADPSILRDALAALQADDDAHQASQAQNAIAAHRQALVADPADPAAGDPAAPFTVVEFYDTRCPYCRAMLPTLAALLRADPTVRVVYKDIPILGPASVLEARALLAAQKQGRYLPLQDALMHAPPGATQASIEAQAARLGLDPVRLRADMADPAVAARLDANLRLAEALHVDGTPALVVGNRLLPGAVQLAELQQAVADARGR